MKRRHFLRTPWFAIPWLGWQHNPHREAIRTMKQPTVINAGIGGNNTQDLLDRIQTDCLAHKPYLTVLMVGTNDMNTRKHIPLPKYTANLHDLCRQITAAGSKLVLMNILPVYEPYLFTRHDQTLYGPEGHAGRKEKVNDAIRATAAKYKAPLVDLHHLFDMLGNIGTDPSSWLQNEVNSGKTDGVHPTPQGYKAIALAAHGTLQTFGLSGKTLVCFGDSITAGDGTMTGDSYPAYLNKLLSNLSETA
jgi:lysophospholipase L1-like esterase